MRSILRRMLEIPVVLVGVALAWQERGELKAVLQVMRHSQLRKCLIAIATVYALLRRKRFRVESASRSA
jgi:hypothetical protein